MKMLVAGGAGFIGSHLIDALIKAGHCVVCVDNFLLGSWANISHHQENPHFLFYEQDICDLDGLRKIFEKETFDYVFHLAANSDIRAGGQNPVVDLKNTYLTTFNLLECMRIYGVKKLFFASTSAIYGDKNGKKMSEDSGPLTPISYYGSAKLGSEALISSASHLNGISTLIFRFPNVVGPRQTHGVIFDFKQKLLRNPLCLNILGDGKQSKPYMYVEDLIRGIMMFMNHADGLTVYNIGVETQTTVTRIADIVCETMGCKDVVYTFTESHGGWPGDVPRFAYDLTKIHTAGWRAKYTSDEAVIRTAEELCMQ